MARFWKQLIGSEKGQALPVVLALLVLGGLTIASALGYATTSLNSSRIIREDVKGVYAADAGVEDTLWLLANGLSPSAQLTENINQMAVVIQTQESGNYTLYFGEFIEVGVHSEYLGINGGIVWDEDAQAYQYTITVTCKICDHKFTASYFTHNSIDYISIKIFILNRFSFVTTSIFCSLYYEISANNFHLIC